VGRFRSASSEEGNEATIDMSPLIDCVFILLIFFIVTTVFVEETGVEVDKPQAASSIQLEKNSILIAITASGQVVYGGQDIGVHGVAPLVERNVRADENIPVIIQADENAVSGKLVEVVGEAKLGGAKNVSLATRMKKG